MRYAAERQPRQLVVENQQAGLAAIQDRATAQLYLRQWETVLQSTQYELTKRIPTIRERFERARQWLMREQTIEAKLVQFTMEVREILDQLEHASDEHVTTELLQQIDRLQQQYAELIEETVASNMPDGELESREENYTVQAAGAAKPRQPDEYLARQLGRFGQDVVRVNRTAGSMVVADGISTAQESFEVARRVSQAAEKILLSIPEHLTDPKAIEEYVVQHLPSLSHSLDKLEGIGGTTLLASRYLDWCDAIVTIDIGDCEQVLVAGDNVILLQPERKHTNTPDNIFIRNKRGALSLRKNKSVKDVVRVVHLADYRRQFPNESLHLVQSTDGIENNIGKTLREVACDIVRGNIETVIAGYNRGKDDIVVGSLTLRRAA